MSKSISFLLICLLTTMSFAQYDGKGEDEISRFRPGVMWFFHGWTKEEVDQMRKYDRLIFDVTYNDWVGDRDLFQNHWASIGLNTNLLFDIPLKKGNTVALGIGLAHQYRVIRHDGNLVRNDSLGTTTWIDKLPSQDFKKSTYGVHSLAIPVEIRFRKESWKHLKLHIGAKVGYQFEGFTKEIGKVNGNRFETKQFGFPDNNHLIYAAHVRFGFRNWGLYGSYNFNKIFSNAQSSSLNALQMGVSISLF